MAIRLRVALVQNQRKLMKPTSIVEQRPRHRGDHQTAIRRIRQLSAPRVVTGKERRWIDPNKGFIKLLERNVDFVVSSFLVSPSESHLESLQLAHNPDHFYEADARGIPLTLSGHTHGGQIRFPNGPPIIRQSRFCLDEGMYSYHSSMLIVSRGLGSVGLPWRWGADPEAILIDILPS